MLRRAVSGPVVLASKHRRANSSFCMLKLCSCLVGTLAMPHTSQRVLSTSAQAFKSDLYKHIADTEKISSTRVVQMYLNIARSLHFDKDPAKINPAQKSRIVEYYMPIALWLQKQVRLGKKHGKPGAVCVGMSIPQGGGKTTLAESMVDAMDAIGVRAAVVSYDDFYLTHQDQQTLSLSHPRNTYLSGRGVAGTHDIDLGDRTLDNMVNNGGSFQVPRYDKSLFDGAGDRAPIDQWPAIRGPLDLVIVEGWMLGFSPVARNQTCESSDDDHMAMMFDKYPGMDLVDQLLHSYKSWESRMDAAILVGVEDVGIVYKWREEAEAKRRQSGHGAMTEEQVMRFCDRYMPSYEMYGPALHAEGIEGVDTDRIIQFMLHPDRSPYLQASSGSGPQRTPPSTSNPKEASLRDLGWAYAKTL